MRRKIAAGSKSHPALGEPLSASRGNKQQDGFGDVRIINKYVAPLGLACSPECLNKHLFLNFSSSLENMRCDFITAPQLKEKKEVFNPLLLLVD